MSLLVALKIFNLVCFYGYGITCLLSKKMKLEFARYGLAKQRILVGALQIAGSTGLAASFYYKPLALASTLGFSAMMFVAVGVRLKIKDSTYLILPAFFFMCLNFYLFAASL